MKPATFIPARNARHRIAVIALYRALLRVGNKFPTPEECRTVTGAHPVVCTIRKRVASNKGITSLRLSYAALSAGYKVCLPTGCCLTARADMLISCSFLMFLPRRRRGNRPNMLKSLTTFNVIRRRPGYRHLSAEEQSPHRMAKSNASHYLVRSQSLACPQSTRTISIAPENL